MPVFYLNGIFFAYHEAAMQFRPPLNIRRDFTDPVLRSSFSRKSAAVHDDRLKTGNHTLCLLPGRKILTHVQLTLYVASAIYSYFSYDTAEIWKAVQIHNFGSFYGNSPGHLVPPAIYIFQP